MQYFKYENISVCYREQSSDVPVLGHSFENDIFYKEIPEFKVVDSMTIIDVGAHIGTFSLYSTFISRNNRIFSLEPNKDTFDLLHKNVVQNKLTNNITPLQIALSDKNGEEKLYLSEDNWEHSLTKNFNGCYELVNTMSLTSLFKTYEIDTCDLIKFNCEGAEFKIILSTPINVLKRIKMMVILFHEDMVDQNFRRGELISYLKENNFRVRGTKMRKNRGWIIATNLDYYNRLTQWIILRYDLVKRLNNIFRAFNK